MEPTRLFPVLSLVALPTVMFGGYSLMRLLTAGGVLSEFQEQFFRAGHAHAGVLLVLSLVCWIYLDRTTLSDGMRWLAGAGLMIGILAQSGGFFLHMLMGAPGQASAGPPSQRLARCCWRRPSCCWRTRSRRRLAAIRGSLASAARPVRASSPDNLPASGPHPTRAVLLAHQQQAIVGLTGAGSRRLKAQQTRRGPPKRRMSAATTLESV